MATKSTTQDGFERLVRPQIPALFRAAYRLVRNRADAEDLVQDVCIKANEHLAQLDECESPLAWLTRVLYHRFVDGARQRKRTPTVATGSTELQGLDGESASAEELASQADRERAFERAWLELEETQRALLSLRAEGYGLAEIAVITGVPEDVLGPRLHRARRSLKRNLDKNRDEEGAVARLGRVR
jgi:RNA polymerase sigma-70 factor (ECF subfamily)